MDKLKAWDSVNKEWVDKFRVYPDGTVEVWTAESGWVNYEKDRVKVMNWIGWKDEDNKPIYEGTHLETEAGTRFRIEYNKNQCRYVVKQINKGKTSPGLIGEDFEVNEDICKNTKVVGHVYTNPEQQEHE